MHRWAANAIATPTAASLGWWQPIHPPNPPSSSPCPSSRPADAAWVRYSAVCGLLRLARAYDSHMPAALYANLALTLQVGGWGGSPLCACFVCMLIVC